jgi:all-trans-retinol 13,14-reductase
MQNLSTNNHLEHPLFSLFKFRDEKKYDVIIIGAGISGLALAAILSKENKKVLVLEQHMVPGGCTHTFVRGKYRWDVGIHYIGEVGSDTEIKKVFDYICETPIEWEDMGNVYDKAYFGNESFEFRKYRENYLAYFSELFPEEKDSLRKYLQLVDKVNKSSRLYFAEKAIPEMISKAFGKWMRKKFLQYASVTTENMLDRLFKNDQLKSVLTAQFGDYGLYPSKSSFAMHAMVVKHYLDGGFYPKGGSKILYDKIAPVIKQGGGEIFVNASVDEILIENNRAIGVRTKSGRIWNANMVISTTGVENTLTELLPAEIKKNKKTRDAIKDLHPSLAYIVLYIGVKKSAVELSLPKCNYWIFPEGYDHSNKMRDYIDGKSKTLPGLYISFTGAKDPSSEQNHAGLCTLEIISLVNYDWFKKWEDTDWKKRGEEYQAYKEHLSNELLEHLYHYVPQLKGEIDYYELATPLTARHFTGYQHGEMYGLEFTPERFKSRHLKPATSIKGLYLAGQDITCTGIGGALMSAILCISSIKKTNYLHKIMQTKN